MNRISIFLFSTCQVVIAAILIALPLAIDPSAVYPVALKGFVLRGLVAVLFVVWALWLVSDRRIRVRVSPLAYILGGFLLVVGGTSLIGIDPFGSIWGSFDRMEGFLTLASFGVFAFIASNVLQQKRDWVRMITVSVAVSSVLAGIGLLESLGVIGRIIPGIGPSATLGNSLHLSGYLLLSSFFVFWLWSLRASGLGRNIVFVLILSLHISALFFTAAKGSHLALLGGLFISAIGLIGSSRTPCWPLMTRRTLLAGAVGVAVALGSVVSLYYVTPAEAPWSVASPADEYFTRSDVQTSFIARYELWQFAWYGIQERPLTGWGLDTFDQAYERYYYPTLLVSRYDRPHNAVLRWWFEGGVAALVLFLLLIIAAVGFLWRIERNDPRCIHAIDLPIFAGFMGAYGIQSLTSYDDASRFLLFFLAIAYIQTQTGRQITLTAVAKYLVMLVGLTVIAIVAPFHIDSARTLYSLATIDEVVRVDEERGPLICSSSRSVRWVRGEAACGELIPLYERYTMIRLLDGFSTYEETREIIRAARAVERHASITASTRRAYRALAHAAIREHLTRHPFDNVLRPQALEFYREVRDDPDLAAEARTVFQELHRQAPGRAATYAE
ncbi:MAG: O-antigen ligase family protein [Candidatus Paceibacterota bacterium]